MVRYIVKEVPTASMAAARCLGAEKTRLSKVGADRAHIRTLQRLADGQIQKMLGLLYH